jgi:hypothetical protein
MVRCNMKLSAPVVVTEFVPSLLPTDLALILRGGRIALQWLTSNVGDPTGTISESSQTNHTIIMKSNNLQCITASPRLPLVGIKS